MSFQGYVFRRTVDGIHIIHLGKAWEKIQVAARSLVTAGDVWVFSGDMTAICLENGVFWWDLFGIHGSLMGFLWDVAGKHADFIS